MLQKAALAILQRKTKSYDSLRSILGLPFRNASKSPPNVGTRCAHHPPCRACFRLLNLHFLFSSPASAFSICISSSPRPLAPLKSAFPSRLPPPLKSPFPSRPPAPAKSAFPPRSLPPPRSAFPPRLVRFDLLNLHFLLARLRLLNLHFLFSSPASAP